MVGVLGVLDDVTRRTPSGFREPGEAVYLLGDTRDEFGGSEWAHVVHDHLGGLPPAVDLEAERALAEVLIAAARDRLVTAAHDVSDGGLAQALVESCLRPGVGVTDGIPEGADPFVFLFAESQARAIVTVPVPAEAQLAELCTAQGVPHVRIGTVAEEPSLVVEGQFSVALAELREVYEATFPARFDA